MGYGQFECEQLTLTLTLALMLAITLVMRWS